MAVNYINGWLECIKELEAGLADGTAVSEATETVAGIVKAADYQAPAAAADVAALKVQFDALLAKLVAAGLMSAS